MKWRAVYLILMGLVLAGVVHIAIVLHDPAIRNPRCLGISVEQNGSVFLYTPQCKGNGISDFGSGSVFHLWRLPV